MKKTLLIIFVITLLSLSIVHVMAQTEEGYDPSQEGFDWDSDRVDLSEGDDVLLPPDYAGEVNVAAGSNVEIPDGFAGTVNINSGKVMLPDGRAFEGKGMYKDGRLMLDDGKIVFDPETVAVQGYPGHSFSGKGTYENGKLRIDKGTIVADYGSNTADFYRWDIEGRGAAYDPEYGEIRGAARITMPDKSVLTTDTNTIYSTTGSNNINLIDPDRPSSISYTAGKKNYDIKLSGNGYATLDMFTASGISRTEIDLSDSIVDEFSTDGRTYKVDRQAGTAGYSMLEDETSMVLMADNSGAYDTYRIKPPKEEDPGKKRYIDPLKKLKQDLLREFMDKLKYKVPPSTSAFG